jgi:hypothetical protein
MMWDDVLFRRMSLKTRLILSYLVILAIGGLATSLVGSWIVSTTLMRQARQTVEHDLATVRTVYQQRLETLERTVELASSGPSFPELLAAGQTDQLLAYLETTWATTCPPSASSPPPWRAGSRPPPRFSIPSGWPTKTRVSGTGR